MSAFPLNLCQSLVSDLPLPTSNKNTCARRSNTERMVCSSKPNYVWISKIAMEYPCGKALLTLFKLNRK